VIAIDLPPLTLAEYLQRPPKFERVVGGKPRWTKPELSPLPDVPDVVPPTPAPPPVVDQLPGALPVPTIAKDGTRAAFLMTISSQIGWFEYQGNVDNPWSNWDTHFTGELAYRDGAYCGQAISWAMTAAGVEGDWLGAASQRYVPYAYNYWASLGRIVPYDQARAGDLVMSDWEGDGVLDHVDVVVGGGGGGPVEVVGYNTGYPEGVHWTTRDSLTVVAVARPSYTDAP
jgi:hypothetical protein